MNTTRRALAGLVAVSMLALGATGCNVAGIGSDAAASPSPSAADARQALLESTKVFDDGNFRFTLTGGSTAGEGLVHVPSKSAVIKMAVEFDPNTDPGNMEFVYIDSDLWIKIDLGPELNSVLKLNEKYLHIDKTKAPDLAEENPVGDGDPASAEAIFEAIIDVKETGEGTYSGTVDLTKASDAGLVDEEVYKALGTAAASVPFTAKTDAEGRLVELALQAPAAGEQPAQELKVTYSDFGAVAAPTKPTAAESMPAPDQVYEMLNS